MQTKHYHDSRRWFGFDESEKLGKEYREQLIEATKHVDSTYPMLSCIKMPSYYDQAEKKEETLNRIVSYVNSVPQTV